MIQWKPMLSVLHVISALQGNPDFSAVANQLGYEQASLRLMGSMASRGEIYMLAENIYREARSEPILTQFLVASVVMNRTKSSFHPDDVPAVIRYPSAFSWRIGSIRRKLPPIVERNAWTDAVLIAVLSLSGMAPDASGGATYFHAPGEVDPVHARKMQPTILSGKLLFLRDPKDAEASPELLGITHNESEIRSRIGILHRLWSSLKSVREKLGIIKPREVHPEDADILLPVVPVPKPADIALVMASSRVGDSVATRGTISSGASDEPEATHAGRSKGPDAPPRDDKMNGLDIPLGRPGIGPGIGPDIGLTYARRLGIRQLRISRDSYDHSIRIVPAGPFRFRGEAASLQASRQDSHAQDSRAQDPHSHDSLPSPGGNSGKSIPAESAIAFLSVTRRKKTGLSKPVPAATNREQGKRLAGDESDAAGDSHDEASPEQDVPVV